MNENLTILKLALNLDCYYKRSKNKTMLYYNNKGTYYAKIYEGIKKYKETIETTYKIIEDKNIKLNDIDKLLYLITEVKNNYDYKTKSLIKLSDLLGTF